MATELVTDCLKGTYHDVLRDQNGQVIWDSGVRNNTIVVNCRRLLAAFMARNPNETVFGISGIFIGAGSPGWDAGVTPTPPEGTVALEDPFPLRIAFSSPTEPPGIPFSIRYLADSANVTSTLPTRRIEISITLPQGIPAWPEPSTNHTNSTLREFGLFGRWQLGPSSPPEDILINCVRHVPIPKDPLSALERKIWLRF